MGLKRRVVLATIILVLLISLVSAAIAVRNVRADEKTGDKPYTSTALPSDMPVVHVDPQSITANPGETFTIHVKIFNLSNNFHQTNEQWDYGEPLGPPGIRHNYSLGGLVGLDIQLKWDPTVLDYVEHTVTMPVETYPEGLLHGEPELIDIRDVVDDPFLGPGTYWLAKHFQYPADAFNNPDANSTAFNMTFIVLKRGVSELTITNSDLAIPRLYPEYIEANQDIPHWRINGFFQTTELATRIGRLEVGALVGEEVNDPIITGEDAEIRVLVRNDNFTASDTHNITIYRDSTVLGEVHNVTLQPTENITYSWLIDDAEIEVGSEMITVNVTSIRLESMDAFETANKSLRVIDVPDLSIQGPSLIEAGEIAAFSSDSTHTDPDGEIYNFTWTLWGPSDWAPRLAEYGEDVEFEIYERWVGNFTVILDVRDNYGITYDPARSATDPWRHTAILQIVEGARATVESCDSTGVGKDFFLPDETVYACGDNFNENESVRVYVVPRGGPYLAFASIYNASAQADNVGYLIVELGTFDLGEYDIWVDMNDNRFLDHGIEPVDTFGSSAGFFIIPELWQGALTGLIACFVSLAAFNRLKRRKP